MGNPSSTENLEDFNLRSDQFPWETLVDPAAKPEKESVQEQAIAEAALERVIRDLQALFPPKLGESSIDQPKEGDTERDDEKVIVRLGEFMEGGACKDIVDCFEADENYIDICFEKMAPKLIKCMNTHSDYYQPIISLAESNLEQMGKEIEALEAEERAERPPV